MITIRLLFSTKRPIDRTIEKVIDYYADDEKRLASEIEEYEITDNVEECFRKFLETFDHGIRSGQVTETGIWVSGFYGSGKSSFTKYLGFSLDPNKKVGGTPFLDLLCDRFHSSDVPALLRTIAAKYPIAVILLDLGAEQLAESAAAPVSAVLYWKVLQWAGFSKDKKLAQLEFTLDRRDKLNDFRKIYHQTFNCEWVEIHNDPLLGTARAAKIVPAILPEEFPTPESFRNLKFEMGDNLRDRVRDMIELCRKKTGCENLLFLLDEAGQYVAPRGELILNMDGLARNLKELGQGKVWIAATGQQTLTEIVEKAAHNSAELNKLRDRFPISIHLDARDIREITYRRLLTKSTEGDSQLRTIFKEKGQSLISHTRLVNTSLYKSDPDADTFTRFYPFLPQHFDLLLELIRTLARSTGGIGLRSVIRVIQDVLVDTSRVLSTGTIKLADRPVGRLACVDDFYDTLRADIGKVLPHVTASVDKINSKIFKDDMMVQRVAKAIATLQPVENFPRTAENIAALLYPGLGQPSLLNEVREALKRLIDEKECSLIEDPQSGGYVFLSEGVLPLRNKRGTYIPGSGDYNRVRNEVLREIFNPQPSTRLEGVKEVKALVRVDKSIIIGDKEDIHFRITFVDSSEWDRNRTEFLTETLTRAELKNAIVWLCRNDEIAEDLISEIVRSEKIVNDTDERNADKDVAQFLRSERKSAERNREEIGKIFGRVLLDGTMIFSGRPIPVNEAGQTIEAAARNVLNIAAQDVFSHFHLAPLRAATDLAAKFLSVERIDRITKDLDPLNLVIRKAGSPRINMDYPALAETLRKFSLKVDESGSGRLQGSQIQDLFSSAPYGWTKDTVRYLFAALLVAGEIEFHTSDGVLKTSGPLSAEAVKSSVAFNRIGISRRDGKIGPDIRDRAARRLEEIFGGDVLPLEDHISRAVRRHFPDFIEFAGALPDRLRLLGLVGEERAKSLLAAATELLKGDASNAAAALGGTDCSIIKDISWAQAAVEALNDGAEVEIKKALTMKKDIIDLQNLYPAETEGLLPEEDGQALSQVLSSEYFYERLPDLRMVVRNTIERIKEYYKREHSSYQEELCLAQKQMESSSAWGLIDDEDREELAKRLNVVLPSTKDLVNPLTSLREVLVRRGNLPRLLSQLQQEVENRKPKPKENAAEPQAEYISKPGEVQVEPVFIGDLIPLQVIKSPQELEAWLDSIRLNIIELLKAQKYVRVEGIK